jgi:hypothetical protein
VTRRPAVSLLLAGALLLAIASVRLGCLVRESGRLTDSLAVAPDTMAFVPRPLPPVTILAPHGARLEIRPVRAPSSAVVAEQAPRYAVLTFTLPDSQGCTPGQRIPEDDLYYVEIQTRYDSPDSVWRDGWRVGARLDTLGSTAGTRLTFGVPIYGPTWFRVRPVDYSGNVACDWSPPALFP